MVKFFCKLKMLGRSKRDPIFDTQPLIHESDISHQFNIEVREIVLMALH